MNDPKFQQHGGENSADHPMRRPRSGWKRIHHSGFFWVATVFILVAMVIYVMSENLAVGPHGRAGKPVPAVAP